MSGQAPTLTANVELPLVIAEGGASVQWTDEADVVVVGLGSAGVCAALQARELNATVIACDRFGGGGASAISGGVVYAGGTRFQREAGYEDTAEEMFKYLRFEGSPVGDATLRRFCELSNENLEWLEKHGARFGSNVYEERTAYPPDGYFLYYTGMEKFRPDKAKVAPRGHRTVGKGPTGRFYYPPLRESALQHGVKFYDHCPARRLVVDVNGRVIGVEIQVIPEDRRAEHESLYRRVNPYKLGNGAAAEVAIAECHRFEARVAQVRRLIKARRGVILASGGYNYNLELFARYRPIVKRGYREIVRGGSMGCDGSGIELGTTVGGALGRMDSLFCTKAISPPNAFIHGILVNMEAKRFAPEDGYAGTVGVAITEQSHDGAAWLILDGKTFWEGVRQATWPLKNIVSWWGLPAVLNILLGGTIRAATIGQLGERLGMSSSALAETVRTYQANARNKTDPHLGKLQAHIRPLTDGPFYALNLSYRNKWGFSGTMPLGGLQVNEDTGAVTRADGSIVIGLYAAGRTAVGVCSGTNFSGYSIADTVFSGRRAARAAVGTGGCTCPTQRTPV